MKFIFALLITIMLFVTNTITAQKKMITATVSNVTSNIGLVNFALFDKTNFKVKALQTKRSKIIEGKSRVVFNNVTAGEYAIICYHDKNENNQLDFQNNGMPSEDYGISNNIMNFGPPKYEDAKFSVTDKNVSLEIRF